MIIRLHDQSGLVLVNVDHIICVERIDSATEITLTEKVTFLVEETVAQIAVKVGAAL
jgi:hypothetical protein